MAMMMPRPFGPMQGPVAPVQAAPRPMMPSPVSVGSAAPSPVMRTGQPMGAGLGQMAAGPMVRQF